MTDKTKNILIDYSILTGLAIFFIKCTWQKWAHPIWDFGREVYIPWRMAQGEVLYKDLAYMFGAFPPLWNAILFKIFGPSLLTINLSNITISLLSTALIYRLFDRIFDRLTAFISAVSFLSLFAFSAHNSHNMYYIAPYTHSCFYALFFGICALNVFWNYTQSPKTDDILLLGACLCLILLSRIEIFLGIAVSLIPFLASFIVTQKNKNFSVFEHISYLTVGFVIPFAVCLSYFVLHLPFSQAVLSIVGYNPNWQKISTMIVYKNLGGWTMLPSNVRSIIMSALLYLAVFYFLSLICIVTRRFKLRDNKAVLFTVTLVTVLILSYFTQKFGTRYALEIFMAQIVLIVPLAFHYGKAFAEHSKERSNALTVLVLCAWSFVMLLKVPLRSAPMSYGYFYALPGVMATIGFILYVAPKHFEHRYQQGRTAQMLLALMLLFIFTVNQFQSISFLKRKNFPVASAADRTFTVNEPSFSLGLDVNNFLQWAQTNIKAGETFVTFPQGVMLNFMTRHTITGSHVTFMPAEMIGYGEQAMLDPLIAHPPDYFILVNQDISVNGNLRLGQNYGMKIFSWAVANYDPIWQTGAGFGYPRFGIIVLKKRPQ